MSGIFDRARLLESDGEPQQVLDELRSLDSPAGRAVLAYLDVVGCRLLDGFDIGGRYALELPDARCARSARPSSRAVEPPDVGEQIADIRSNRAASAQFDELVDEARLMYGSATSAGSSVTAWASGIMRRPPWRRAGGSPTGQDP